MTFNKKAISPLIATVLLLAFAVAVGTMVVSYVLDATKSTPCDDVALALEGAQTACYSDGNVRFILVNQGDTPIIGAKVRLLSANGDINEARLGNALEPASASKIDVPFTTLNPTGVTMTLVPIIRHDKELFCTDKELRVQLKTC